MKNLLLDDFNGLQKLGVPAFGQFGSIDVGFRLRQEELDPIRQLHFQVRGDPSMPDSMTLGGEPLRDSQEHERTVVELVRVKHCSHSSRSASDQLGSAVIFKRASHEFGAAGGLFVNEDAHGKVARLAAWNYYVSEAIAFGILFQNDSPFA